MQLDPPESAILQSLCASISFLNRDAMLATGLLDGTLRGIVEDVMERHAKGELKVAQPWNAIKLKDDVIKS